MIEKQHSWSSTGKYLAIWSAIAAIVLALADGLFKGPLSFRFAGTSDYHADAILSMLATWSYDLRQVADNLVFVGVVLFVGAKLLETRTLISIGFDRIDAGRISMKELGDDNVVWVGRRYDSRLEAEAVAAQIESRLRESA
jgi:hypothetical protein